MITHVRYFITYWKWIVSLFKIGQPILKWSIMSTAFQQIAAHNDHMKSDLRMCESG